MNRNAVILLVEDNPGDVELLREAFALTSYEPRLEAVQDGGEALAYLRREGHFEEAPRPDIVLLDLQLPVLCGHDVLSTIKGDPGLCRIPVIVMSSSRREEDVRRSYELHASCHLAKPTDFDAFQSIAQRLGEFWLDLAEIPTA